MFKLLIIAAALVAAPVAAQAPGAVPVPADPAHLALARTSIDLVWPLGTYERMMKGTMDRMMDTMFDSIFDMRVDQLGEAAGEKAQGSGQLTIRESMAKEDPHFRERMQIMTRVMVGEMIPIMNRIEPDIREGLTRAYARKFTSEQLADMNRFFATPTGRVYAAEAMLTMMEPEVMTSMMKLTPEFVREMPRIMKKMEEATASLPPPPKRKPAAER